MPNDRTPYSGEELKMSAGWSCYCWLLGSRPDSEFSETKLAGMLNSVKNSIHKAPERTKYAMSNFIYTVGVSYRSLHEQAVETAKAVGQVEVMGGKKFLNPSDNIQKALSRGQLGFKRKHVRC